jgi:hypothetical protein
MEDLKLTRSASTNHWRMDFKGDPLGVISLDRKNHIRGHEGWFLSFRSFPGIGEDVAATVALKRVCRTMEAKVIYAEVAHHDVHKQKLLTLAGFSEVLDGVDLDHMVLVWLRP